MLARVRCLACGSVYAKPVSGGTMRANPGCPSCGYLGWVTLDVELGGEGDEPSRRLRSVADLRLRPSAR
jgi:predicted  nucleic acid-binding Zn-ribbon protein